MEYSDIDKNPGILTHVVARMAALADETRLRILMRLKASPCSVGQLAGELAAGQASVSKHLAILKQVGLVAVVRQGNMAIYSIHDQSVFEMCAIVCAGVTRHVHSQYAAVGLDAPRHGERRQRKPISRAAVR